MSRKRSLSDAYAPHDCPLHSDINICLRQIASPRNGYGLKAMWTSGRTISNSFMSGGPMRRPSSALLPGAASVSSSYLLIPSETKSKKSCISTSLKPGSRMCGRIWLLIAGPLLTYIRMCTGVSSREQAGRLSKPGEWEEAIASSRACPQMYRTQFSIR